MAEKDRFELVSPYKPTGDQPQAIENWRRECWPGTRSRHCWA